MTKRSRTVRSALVALMMVALATVGLSSASAAARQPIVYDALGDSYASGYGVDPSSYTGGTCARSDAAYAVQVSGREKLALDQFVACAGATTLTLVSRGQLAALDDHTDLVTLQIGGNDTHWGDAVVACVLGTDAQCTGTIATIRGIITGALPGLLDSVYDQVAAKAPNAHVIVAGYPRLFSPEYGSYLYATPQRQQALNDGADLLNSVIAAAAARHGFQFVDVTKRFDGHGVNAPDAWILGLGSPGPFHPNAAGYEAYTAAITAAVNPARLK
jgi:lysophospholipase L1-like esterase